MTFTNSISPEAVEQLVDCARSFDFAPSVLGLAVADEATWRAALISLPRERVTQISQKLDELRAARFAEEKRAELRHISGVLAGTEEPTPEEAALAEQARAEAEAELQRYEARRPARVEALLQRIAASIENLKR